MPKKYIFSPRFQRDLANHKIQTQEKKDESDDPNNP
jgi:hypothetical protein